MASKYDWASDQRDRDGNPPTITGTPTPAATDDYSYELATPDDHLFVPVPKQTGCKRCGYARGHHPTAAMLRQWQRDNDITPEAR